jgi:hypothetical protein
MSYHDKSLKHFKKGLEFIRRAESEFLKSDEYRKKQYEAKSDNLQSANNKKEKIEENNEKSKKNNKKSTKKKR